MIFCLFSLVAVCFCSLKFNKELYLHSFSHRLCLISASTPVFLFALSLSGSQSSSYMAIILVKWLRAPLPETLLELNRTFKSTFCITTNWWSPHVVRLDFNWVSSDSLQWSNYLGIPGENLHYDDLWFFRHSKTQPFRLICGMSKQI